jgi:hypothetical protein
VAHVGDELRLVLACDLKLTALLCYLVEQPSVLDRDDGLVCEGVDELDLAVGEWAHFRAPDEDHANCRACVDQRDAERGAPTALEGRLPAFGVFILFGEDVGDVNRSLVDDRTPCYVPTAKA